MERRGPEDARGIGARAVRSTVLPAGQGQECACRSHRFVEACAPGARLPRGASERHRRGPPGLFAVALGTCGGRSCAEGRKGKAGMIKPIVKRAIYGALDLLTAGRGVRRTVGTETYRFPARWSR